MTRSISNGMDDGEEKMTELMEKMREEFINAEYIGVGMNDIADWWLDKMDEYSQVMFEFEKKWLLDGLKMKIEEIRRNMNLTITEPMYISGFSNAIDDIIHLLNEEKTK